MKILQSAKCKVQILNLVLILLIFTYNAEAQGLFNIDTIPAPPQSTKLETRKEQSEINQITLTARITHYQSPLSPDVIVGFYQQNLPAKGWQILGQGSKGPVAMASFSKGDENLSISAYTLGAGQTDIYISRSVTPQGIMPEPAHGRETPGKDLARAPRYPGSPTTINQRDKQTGVTMVSYAVNAEATEIINFYQRKMPDNGWRFVKDVKLAELPGFGRGSYTTLLFEGFRGQCQVSINKADDFEGLDSAAVLINYIPQGAAERIR